MLSISFPVTGWPYFEWHWYKIFKGKKGAEFGIIEMAMT